MTRRLPKQLRALLAGTTVAAALACGSSGTGTGGGSSGPPGGTEQTGTHEILAAGLRFEPSTFLSTEQLRPSLAVHGGEVYVSDASDVPVKKIAIGGGGLRPVAERIGVPTRVAVQGTTLYWSDGDSLRATDTVQGTTTLLASGNVAPTPALLADADGAYWVRARSSAECGGVSCRWAIERVTATGATILAERTRTIYALAQDATSLYWQEGSTEPVSPGCDCGATVRSIPKQGGATTILVDNRLNGTLPEPPPGHIPGSWIPVGGIAVSGGWIYLGDRTSTGYRITRIPAAAGGILEPVATIADDSIDSAAAPVQLAADGAGVCWIDSTGMRAPAAGASTVTLASGLQKPRDLVLAGGQAYVVEEGRRPGTGALSQVARTGGSPQLRIGHLDAPTSVATDGTRLYWAEAWRVGATASNGTATTLASGIQHDLPKLLFVGDQLLAMDGVFLKRIVPGGAEKVGTLRTPAGEAIAARIEDVVTDGISVYAAWRPGNVVRIPLDGGATTQWSGTAMSPQDCLARVAVEGGQLFWTGASPTSPVGCVIQSTPIAGGPTRTLVDGPIVDFVLAGNELFFSELRVNSVGPGGTSFVGSESVNRIPAAGGTVTKWNQPGFPFLVAVDDARLYWLSPSGNVSLISWMPRSGGTVGTVTVGGSDLSSIYVDAFVADSTGLYWTNALAGSIERMTVR